MTKPLYISFSKKKQKVDKTQFIGTWGKEVSIDFNKKGEVIGVEILDYVDVRRDGKKI